jgi:hypothetical protein
MTLRPPRRSAYCVGRFLGASGVSQKVFISYRRDTARYQARQIMSALREVLPGEQVFMDYDSIPLGHDFRSTLKGWVEQCDIMLALINPGWADALEPGTDRRRIDNPSDFVRIEVAAALARGIPVVPIMLDRADLPDPQKLPADLQNLVDRQAEFVEFRTFDHDVARLISRLGLSPESNLEDPKPAPAGRPAVEITPSSVAAAPSPKHVSLTAIETQSVAGHPRGEKPIGTPAQRPAPSTAAQPGAGPLRQAGIAPEALNAVTGATAVVDSASTAPATPLAAHGAKDDASFSAPQPAAPHPPAETVDHGLAPSRTAIVIAVLVACAALPFTVMMVILFAVSLRWGFLGDDGDARAASGALVAVLLIAAAFAVQFRRRVDRLILSFYWLALAPATMAAAMFLAQVFGWGSAGQHDYDSDAFAGAWVGSAIIVALAALVISRRGWPSPAGFAVFWIGAMGTITSILVSGSNLYGIDWIGRDGVTGLLIGVIITFASGLALVWGRRAQAGFGELCVYLLGGAVAALAASIPAYQIIYPGYDTASPDTPYTLISLIISVLIAAAWAAFLRMVYRAHRIAG